ncbi:MAG: hypothetical protein ACRELV_11830 [Longimicrobiales bacterium]
MTGVRGRRIGVALLAAAALLGCDLEFTDPARPTLHYWIRATLRDSVTSRLSVHAGLVADVGIDVGEDPATTLLRVNGVWIEPAVGERSLTYAYEVELDAPGAVVAVVEPPAAWDARLPTYELNFLRRSGPREIVFDPRESVELPLAVPDSMPAIDQLLVDVFHVGAEDGSPVLHLVADDGTVPDTIRFSAQHLGATDGAEYTAIVQAFDLTRPTPVALFVGGTEISVGIHSVVRWRLTAIAE